MNFRLIFHTNNVVTYGSVTDEVVETVMRKTIKRKEGKKEKPSPSTVIVN